MCGVVGFYDPNRRVDRPEETLERMTRTLTRRGPDDSGAFHNGPWHLGHRRLSILDLTMAGHQPMLSDDGQVAVVFNGEIYNFEEVRRWLESRGHVFRSRSDTEVLLRAYIEEGDAMLARLNGMMAFAILDLRKNRLIAARDRGGKKPLYYTHQNGVFAFASELKALAACPALRRTIDPESVRMFFGLDYIPSPKSIYQEFKKLRPGHYLIFDGHAVTEQCYWQMRYVPKLKTTDEEEIRRELSDRIRSATKMRLVADVPVGVLLSGGIDSTIVAMFAQETSTQKVRTFSVKFEDAAYDESRYARIVADRLGTDHMEFTFTVKDALGQVDAVFDYLDEPYSDPSLLPTSLLCRETVKHVTVALGGDAGDEIFYGYPTYQAEVGAWMFKPISFLTPAFRAMVRAIPTSDKYMSWPFKLDRFFRGVNVSSPVRRHLIWRGPFDPETMDSVMGPSPLDIYGSMVDEVMSNGPYDSPFEPLLYSDFRYYLQDGVLVKVDRASMMYSLETRAPLMDLRVMEFAAKIPRKILFKNLRTKAFFRSLIAGRMPDEIVYRAKRGFAVPVSAWLKNELRDVFLGLWDSPHAGGGMVDPARVRAIYDEHVSGRRDRRKELWALLTFQMWLSRFHKAAHG